MTLRLLQAIPVVFFAAFFAAPVATIAEESIHKNLDAEILGEQLLLLRSDKRIQVWDLQASKLDFDESQKLSSTFMEFIAVANGRLWGLNENGAYLWRREEGEWLPKNSWRKRESEPLGFVVVGNSPFVIFERHILRLADQEHFDVPEMKDHPEGFGPKHLRPLEIKAIDSQILIGNGYGEWGGNLLSFNTLTEKWEFYVDSGHYVTGITRIYYDRIAVSWSMSHFMAHAILRIHAGDASVVKEFEGFPPRGGSMDAAGYLQKIAYDKTSGYIYAVEQNNFVRLANGQPEKIAELGPLLYIREPRAIGIVPGVLAMFSTENAGIIVVHRDVAPFVFKDGVLNQLKQ